MYVNERKFERISLLEYYYMIWNGYKKNIYVIEIYVNNIFYLEWKCVWIIVCGYCLFLDLNSFLRVKLEVKF